jgi:hypothetical protein
VLTMSLRPTWRSTCRILSAGLERLERCFVLAGRFGTFDIDRHEAALPDVLAAYAVKARAPLPRAIIDQVLHCTAVDLKAVWDGLYQPEKRAYDMAWAIHVDGQHSSWLMNLEEKTRASGPTSPTQGGEHDLRRVRHGAGARESQRRFAGAHGGRPHA